MVAPNFTAFPTPIGLAATWDPDAVQEMADIMRRQMRSVGMLHALAPVMDVARDARWGRVTETYGEDPYLVSAMSVAFTRGMQGQDLREGVIACAKHFLGYAQTEAGQNMAAVAVGPRELYDVFARPFEAAIRLAVLGGVHGVVLGVRGRADPHSRAVLTDLLRGRLGFTGPWKAASSRRTSSTSPCGASYATSSRSASSTTPMSPRIPSRSAPEPARATSFRGASRTSP